MSDPGSTTPPADATKLSSPPSGSLAFLVHSPDTVRSNLPPDVDNKPLARQKRRRTSPEDQKILEAEYQRNSKPDKAARLEIVKRVALGEKEVQIWFQNRRQNTRRKSRPLEPHEIQSHLSSSQEPITEPSSSAPNSDDAEGGEQEQHVGDVAVAPLNNSHNLQETPARSPTISTEHVPKETASPSAPDLTNVEHQATNAATELPKSPAQVSGIGPAEFGSSQPLPSSQESQHQGIGYLANRRSQSFIRTYEEAMAENSGSVPSSQEQAPPRTLKKSSSFVRLSMTEDGKARVITGEDSPSPPRSQPNPTPVIEKSEGLRRSYSAAALNDRLKQAQSPQGIQRSFSGRSRDSRAWEFWCDSDARNSLTEKANQEGSGSAADAIGLIRSASRGALKLNPNKRNAQLLTQSSAKRVKLDGKSTHRPPLSRSSSSQGRLQGKAAPVSRTPLKKSQSAVTKKADDDGFEVPQTESDKENWEPGVPGTSLRRTKPPTAGQQPGQPRRRVLGENTNIMSTSGSLGTMMDREKGLKATPHKRLLGPRTSNPEDDDELRAFMGGAGGHSQRTSVSSGEELGCVEGLLKLSQGNWR
ncbi:Homeobox protein YOX1 [Lasiodiplodia hormozganensis]|uniref:Homeobox protein YOX1 n=1 Tax=Lasiodiplodia hormozganensis TaxID=869390 RepID=A0AA39YVX3_9PEZI|nr:Homeobox protein YOX1 [Lasiodiplodia hormozganensis]